MSQATSLVNMTDAEKRAALAVLLQQKATRYPLSYGQLSMWFHQQLYPESSAYNIPLSFVLNGKISDISLVEKSLAYVVNKNDALRTRFKFDGEEPCQYIEKNVPIDLTFRDFQQQANEDWQKAVLVDSTIQANQAFNLETGNLFRTELLKISETRYVIQLTIHHIIFDGWSIGVLLRDFAAAFVAYYDNVELPSIVSNSSYKHFVLQQRKLLNSPRFAPKLDYWVNRLAGCNEALDLPLDFPRPEKQTFAGKVYIEPVNKALSERLSTFARVNNCTLFTLLQSCVYLLFGKLSGQKDVVVGVSQANRDEVEYRDAIGLFSQVLPMRGMLDDELTIQQFISQVQQHTLTDLEHGSVPLSTILDALKTQRDPSRNMLFQIGLDYQNTPWPESLGELVYLLTGDAESSKLDINFNISKNPDGMLVIIEYNTDLFLESTIAHFAGIFVHLLDYCINNPEQKLDAISLVNNEERKALVACCFGEPLEDDLSQSVIHKIAYFAKHNGNQPALSGEGFRLTYLQLYEKMCIMADHLSCLGVSAKTPIAIDMPRTEQQLVSALAVMASGGSYLPLDHGAPDNYKCEIMQDAGCCYLLRLDDHQIDMPKLNCINVAGVKNENDSRVRQFDLRTHHVAYVIYTSGSTGKPKGVVVTHDNLRIYCEAACKNYGIDSDDKMLQFANLCFDTSVEEIFPTFWAGAELTLRPEDLHERLLDYFKYCQSNAITCVNMPTTFWHNLMDELHNASIEFDLKHLKLAVIGGEAVRLDRVAVWQKVMPKHIRLLNTYGPSETTVAVTSARLESLSRLNHATGIATVGAPLPFCNVVVIDESGNVLPRGVFGELLILGPTVSDGYYHNPSMTLDRFGERAVLGQADLPYFKSGDIGRYTLDGQIEFKGRRDSQIKNRGNRVELSHIEKIVDSVSSIRQSAVVQMQLNGSTKLVAFATAEANSVSQSVLILDKLRQLYADYLVPDLLVFIEQFPLTASGKINRKELTKLSVIEGPKADAIAPSTETEKAILAICGELLGAHDFGVEANFFALGGHSLLLAKLIARMTKQFDVIMPVKAVYESKTLADLATAIDGRKGLIIEEDCVHLPLQPRADETQLFDPSSTQRRLWFLHQVDPNSTAYLIPKSFDISGDLNIGALHEALNLLVKKHEVLRTRIATIDGQPMQEVHRHVNVDLSQISLRHYSPSERERQRDDLIFNDTCTPLDIGTLPVIRCTLIEVNEDQYVFLFAIHHVLVDGISMAILLNDLGEFYAKLNRNEILNIAPNQVQFADFSSWQNAYFKSDQFQQSIQFWQRYLAKAQLGLALPFDRTPGDSQTHVAATVKTTLNSECKAGLNRLLQAAGGSMYTTLLTALNLCLVHYCDQRDIVVGTVVDGRDHPDVQNTVGFFANTLLIRTQVDTLNTIETLLNDSLQALMSIQEHKDVPLDDVINALGWSSNRLQGMLDVLFLYEKRDAEEYTGTGLSFQSRSVVYNQAKVPLSLSVHEYEQHIELIWEYSVDLFDQSTIDNIAQHFAHLVAYFADSPALDTLIKQIPLSELQNRTLPVVTPSETSSFRSVNDFLQDAASAYPDSAALVCNSQTYSYSVLHQRAETLAVLMCETGLQAGEYIGLCLNRNVDLVVAMLAAFKAKLTYVPIDPNYPASKIAHIIAQTGCRAVLVHHQTANSVGDIPHCQVVFLDDEALQSSLLEAKALTTEVASDPEHITHVIMTSGSTGTPKIVQIRDDSVVALIEWAQQTYDYPNEKVLASTSITFDLSVFEIIVSLCSGSTVVLVDSVLDLVEQSFDVTLINTVPSAARTLLSSDCVPSSVRTLNLAGEALSPQLVEDVFALSHVESVYNLYGPSEDTTYSTVFKMDTRFDGQVTIGKPINGTQSLVLNQWQIPVPQGVAGELYLAGRGISSGYLNQPELTEQSFVYLDHIDPSLRLYKTGDFVRQDELGSLHYIGRKDHQVKIRGYRIELDDIRFNLMSQDTIHDAAVVVSNGNLHAFVTPEQSDLDKVSDILRQRVPSYMMPSTIESMSALPLSAHGKIDLNALRERQNTEHGNSNTLPETDTQLQLATLWKEVLPVDLQHIYLNDSFYHLGGHSLLMVRLFYRAKEHFEIDFSLFELMQALTLSGQAELLDSKLALREGAELERQEW